MADPNALLKAAKTMDDVQQRVFTMYVALGPTRTLKQLLVACKDRGINVTQRMLDRWSSRWHWSDLAVLTQQQLASEIAEAAKPALKKLTQEDLASIATLKERFHKRVQIDPFDPNLPEKERELAIIPDLNDYEKLLRIERLILSDPEEANAAKGSRVEKELSDGEVVTVLRERTITIHGLPPPEVVQRVTEALPNGD